MEISRPPYQRQESPSEPDHSSEDELVPKVFIVYILLIYVYYRKYVHAREARTGGTSSWAGLARKAMDAKQEYNEALQPNVSSSQKGPNNWTPYNCLRLPQEVVRNEYKFPAPDLMAELFRTFFSGHNLMLPLLHRPTFLASIAREEHLHNAEFGALVLLVCSTAARHLNDPRVLADPSDLKSAGSQWVRLSTLIVFSGLTRQCSSVK